MIQFAPSYCTPTGELVSAHLISVVDGNVGAICGSGVAVFVGGAVDASVGGAVGVSVGGAVGASVGGAVGASVGGAVGCTSVCVGSGVLGGDFVLTGKGVWISHDVAVADLSVLSATVSVPGGAQDVNTKASTKPPRRNHIVLIEGHDPPLLVRFNYSPAPSGSVIIFHQHRRRVREVRRIEPDRLRT